MIKELKELLANYEELQLHLFDDDSNDNTPQIRETKKQRYYVYEAKIEILKLVIEKLEGGEK